MENIKVNVPEGYEIDRERSNIDLERGIVDIKLKEKVKRWRDKQNAKISGFWIDSHSDIDEIISNYNTPENYNIFATEKQAKSALAMARISQIMANDARFGGAITNEEWGLPIYKWIIYHAIKSINVQPALYYNFLAFHTCKQAQLFMEENIDLIKDYFIID